MVALDADGRVIRDALLWNDTRSADAAAELIAEFGADELAARTGLVPVASFTITKLRWLRDNEPENAARVAAVALPHDWLTWRLRGFGPENPNLDELITDPLEDGRRRATGIRLPESMTRELLISALGHDVVLPRVLGPDESTGDAEGRRVGPGAGDNAGAALGLGQNRAMSWSPSAPPARCPPSAPTRSQTPRARWPGSPRSDRALPPTRRDDQCRAGAGGDSIPARRLARDELSALALQAEPGADGLTLLPYFEGERTPNLPNATAKLTGMTLSSTTRPNLARAAVEGMLRGLGAGLDAMRALGVPLDRALLIGGGAQSEAVRLIAPEVLGVPVEVPRPAEYVALGAARQAMSVLPR